MALENALGMTDEEFLNQDLSMLEDELDNDLEPQDTNDINESDEEHTSEDGLNEGATQEIEASESNTGPIDDEYSDEEVTDPVEDTLLEDENLYEESEQESQDTDVTTESIKADTDEDTQETAGIDYEGAYKRIMSPFKASKRMMQIDNIDDAVKLMQMGADYSNKMKSIKPNLRVVSMLEKEGLLDEAKINNLIDLSKKNPAAITKLIKESGIDPLDIDTDAEDEYKPNDYRVSDTEFNVNQALDDIKDSPTFDRTLNILAKEWDGESKKLITENPSIIPIINDHVYNGVYDKVQSIIDSERALGRLQVPDVVAYKQVAEYLQYRGDVVPEGHNTPPPVEAFVPKTKAKNDEAVKQKRKAAASTKKTTSKKTSAEPDYLKMTDDEFMKMAASS